MLLRPFLNDQGSCASYVFGCTSHRKLAVVDPHADLVEGYLEAAERAGSPIVAVFETHVRTARRVRESPRDACEAGAERGRPACGRHVRERSTTRTEASRRGARGARLRRS